MWVVELGVIPCVKPGLHPQIASWAGHPLPWAPALSPSPAGCAWTAAPEEALSHPLSGGLMGSAGLILSNLARFLLCIPPLVYS